ncbi:MULTISPECIES: hypothetical protein [unclassified Mameliella]|uniref:hypothetical protein n=1 Tax=Mameliella sp. LZ-28 TaxID=2484146 RepID=UPI00143FAE02|nr:hypothetical protein [Mameliella sp. LZ-28]MCR9276213.1 hypothetical protein [Paracoccaceae bacterium]
MSESGIKTLWGELRTQFCMVETDIPIRPRYDPETGALVASSKGRDFRFEVESRPIRVNGMRGFAYITIAHVRVTRRIPRGPGNRPAIVREHGAIVISDPRDEAMKARAAA